MKPLLTIEDLTICYNRVPAVHHVTLELSAGRLVALLGPNGAGKTTLLKGLARLLPYETGNVHCTAPIAYVPQRNAVDWDFPITVRALVEMGCYRDLGLWRKFSAENESAVNAALEATDLVPLAERQIGKLSAGQQQRAFLARALVQRADVVLLDEPFASLDIQSCEMFVTALHRLRDMGKLIIIAHHDLTTVATIFDEVILLNDELVAAGSVATTFTKENLRRTFETKIFHGEEGEASDRTDQTNQTDPSDQFDSKETQSAEEKFELFG